MNSKLIEAEENYYFYCNNCKSKFSFIYTFYPTNNSKEYYICSNCNSMLPVSDIKKSPVNNFLIYFCCCFN
jgi:hypothetical protein